MSTNPTQPLYLPPPPAAQPRAQSRKPAGFPTVAVVALMVIALVAGVAIGYASVETKTQTVVHTHLVQVAPASCTAAVAAGQRLGDLSSKGFNLAAQAIQAVVRGDVATVQSITAQIGTLRGPVAQARNTLDSEGATCQSFAEGGGA